MLINRMKEWVEERWSFTLKDVPLLQLLGRRSLAEPPGDTKQTWIRELADKLNDGYNQSALQFHYYDYRG